MNTRHTRPAFQLVVAVATVVLLTVQVALASAPAAATTLPVPNTRGCVQGTLPHGALSLICVPRSGWNGALVVWAHGYVAPNKPLDFYDLTIGDLSLPDLTESLGFAFATTSYRQNGLAILEGVDDVAELVAAFPVTAGRPASRTYLVGASEGGIVTTLLAERKPWLIDGGLALCGPIGNFVAQIDYVGDFRVLFDYFFPHVLPGRATQIPAGVVAGWDSRYAPRIRAALAADPLAALQLIRTSGAAVIPGDASSIANTTLALLWYGVFSTNDAAAKLGGNPYGNIGRWYSGSIDDLQLNLGVERATRSPAADAAVAAYQTSGRPGVPLVTLHTTSDPVIPYWQEIVYALKAHGGVPQIPVARYGHCAFTGSEVLGAFGLLLQWSASQ